ncbi:MAG: hypothetical protein ACFB6R_16335 [Alphaproteobacteria bacterium]
MGFGAVPWAKAVGDLAQQLLYTGREGALTLVEGILNIAQHMSEADLCVPAMAGLRGEAAGAE